MGTPSVCVCSDRFSKSVILPSRRILGMCFMYSNVILLYRRNESHRGHICFPLPHNSVRRKQLNFSKFLIYFHLALTAVQTDQLVTTVPRHALLSPDFMTK